MYILLRRPFHIFFLIPRPSYHFFFLSRASVGFIPQSIYIQTSLHLRIPDLSFSNFFLFFVQASTNFDLFRYPMIIYFYTCIFNPLILFKILVYGLYDVKTWLYALRLRDLWVLDWTGGSTGKCLS